MGLMFFAADRPLRPSQRGQPPAPPPYRAHLLSASPADDWLVSDEFGQAARGSGSTRSVSAPCRRGVPDPGRCGKSRRAKRHGLWRGGIDQLRRRYA
jgi:hypothetical protein